MINFKPKPITLTELLKMEFGEKRWIVKDLVPEGITILSGDPGNFKTWVMIEIIGAVARGRLAFNHFETTSGPVLFIDEENGAPLLKERSQKLGIEGENVHLLIYENLKLDDPDCLLYLQNYIKEHEIKLVCIDSLVRIHSKDENVANQMSEVATALKNIIKLGASVLITHHHRKAGGVEGNQSSGLRGSTDILAAIECHLSVKYNEAVNKIIVSQHKLRSARRNDPVELDIVEDAEKIAFVFKGKAPTSSENKMGNLKKRILELVKQKPLRRSSLVKTLSGEDFGGNAVGLALKELVSQKVLIVTKEKRNKLYCMTLTTDSDQEPTD